MELFTQLLSHYGLWVVLVVVVMDQGGLPVPAWPVLTLAAAQAVAVEHPVWPVLAVSTPAALLADTMWYLAGRRYGAQMMRLICRVSLSPDRCMATTHAAYARWGVPSLVIAKFVPGLAAMCTTLSGYQRAGAVRFAIFAGLGAALWAGSAVAVGVLFHDVVNDVIETLESIGPAALALIACAAVMFAARKRWKQRQNTVAARVPRITATELMELRATNGRPLVVDGRDDTERYPAG